VDPRDAEQVEIGRDAVGCLGCAAPQAAAEFLNSRPPMMKTSTVGWSTRAAAVVGLWVTIVAARSGHSASTTARAVVPLSRITVIPGVMNSARLPDLAQLVAAEQLGVLRQIRRIQDREHGRAGFPAGHTGAAQWLPIYDLGRLS
jgi:hypothetical protein